MRPYKSIFREGIESEKVGENKFYFSYDDKNIFLDKKFKQLLKGVNADMSLEDAGKKIEDNMLEYENTHDEVAYEGMELCIKVGGKVYFYSDGWEIMESFKSLKRNLRESESIIADTYSNNKEDVEDAIITTADSFIGKENSENAINAMYDEGIFDPFIEAGADEDEVQDNEEEQFEASKIWIKVLSKTDKKKYAKIIAEFKRIEMDGL